GGVRGAGQGHLDHRRGREAARLLLRAAGADLQLRAGPRPRGGRPARAPAGRRGRAHGRAAFRPLLRAVRGAQAVSAVRYRRPAALATLGERHAVVEASAGTGKTYVLEHLVVDLILRRGVELPQILIVTFTEKATAELVQRLRAKLQELRDLWPDHQ